MSVDVATAEGQTCSTSTALLLTETVLGYRDAIRRTALRITRSESAANDVMQDVFVRVLSKGGYDSRRGSLEQWLQIVAHNVAIDWVRCEAAHQRRITRVGVLHSATLPIVDESVTEHMQAANVRAAVDRLPENEREAVLLAYFGGLSYRQVADRLGVPEGTVKSRIRRGLTRLAHLIGTDVLVSG